MHNRDVIWKTADGRCLKLRDMTSSHLDNAYKYINKNIAAYNQKYGKKTIKKLKNNMLQEIRLRKLNRLKNNEEELF